MIGGVTRRTLPHLSGVPHLHVNRPLEYGTFYVNQVLINMKFCEKKYAIHGRNEKFKIEPAEVLESTHPKTNKPSVKTYSFLNELQSFKPRQNLSPETKALQKTTRHRIK